MLLMEKIDFFVSDNLSDTDDGRLLRALYFHKDTEIKTKVRIRTIMRSQRPKLEARYHELFKTPFKELT